MILICRAQLLGNSLGYYLVADRSILESFEILRLRIGIMWSDASNTAGKFLVDFHKNFLLESALGRTLHSL
ncbi:MAG: hypothetical protein H0W50_03035 [Parachlamydiaceae bacterium]|nr:hypothetical protein [Parachlamydiaceae bacterium]